MVGAHLVSGGASAGDIDCSLMSRRLFATPASFFLFPLPPALAFAVDSWYSVARLLKVSYAPRGVQRSSFRESCLYCHHLQQLLLCAANKPALAIKVKQSQDRFSPNYSLVEGGDLSKEDGKNSLKAACASWLPKAPQACRCPALAKAKTRVGC